MTARLTRPLTLPLLLRKFAGHYSAVTDVAFNPDGKTLAMASEGEIKLWELPPAR